MAKRPTFEVDEDYMKEIMAGEIPVYPKRSSRKAEKKAAENDESSDVSEESASEESNDETATDESKKEVDGMPKDVGRATNRRKKDVSSYEETFLKRTKFTEKRAIYISREIHRMFSSFLPTITDDISMTMYIDNILAHHLECYKNEINDLIVKRYKQPLIK